MVDQRKKRRERPRVNVRTRYPRLTAPKSGPPARAAYDPTGIVLGASEHGVAVVLPQRPRLEHMHAIGATGSGKTNFLEHCIRQDIQRGCGVCVIDPHGNHPDSLYRSLLAWIDHKGLTKTRTIHLIDPNARSHTVGFNPLQTPDDETDMSVIAGTTLDAFARVWGDEDTHQKPTIRRILKATFAALAELNLTLAEADLLFDPHDTRGVRALILSKLTDRYARNVFAELHQLSKDERSKKDFRAEVVGPINRIGEFVSAPAIRNIIGQTNATIDLRAALDDGHIILANLSGGQRVYEADAELLGRLLTRFLFFHAKRRQHPERPFWFYLDECQRYLSGDVPELLGEARKYGMGVVLSHQWLGQLKDAGENILSAVLNGPNLKAVFRLKDPKEAEQLAEAVIPFDLETPVKALVRPTVVGHKRTIFKSQGSAEHHARSSAIAVSETDSFSESVSDSEAESVSDSTSDSEGSTTAESAAAGMATANFSGWSSGSGSSEGSTMTPALGWFETPAVLADSAGNSASSSAGGGRAETNSNMSGSSSGQSRGRTSGRSSGRSSGHTVSRSSGHSTSVTEIEAQMHGTSRSEGATEGLEPVYEVLPSSVHSLENVRYMAAQQLRSLTVGEAYLSYVGMDGWRGTRLSVPRVGSPRISAEGFSTIRERIFAASPSALPALDAQNAITQRERKLIDGAKLLNQSPPEPEEPKEFRVPRPKAKKGTEGRRSHGKPATLPGAHPVKGDRGPSPKAVKDP